MKCVLLSLWALLAVATAREAPPRPHILYFMIDDQGYGDVGYTSDNSSVTTPLIDWYARKGLILDRHYTAWMCTPTRASFMTGKYPMELGIQHDIFLPNTEECLNEEEILLPEPLKANGYATHLVGKWHLGYARWNCMPCMRGFDTSYGYTQGEIDYMSHTNANYNDFYSCAYNEEEDHLDWEVLPGKADIYSMELYRERAAHIIQTHNTSTPLFLFMSLQTVHSPYGAPKEFYGENCSNPSAQKCVLQAMMNAAEYTINGTIHAMKEAGMWENTIMIYMSDNGAVSSTYTSNWPLKGYKGFLWEGGVRTPAYVYAERRELLARRGRTSCYLHVSDWFATIVALAGGWEAWENTTGITRPSGLDGIDQSQFLFTGDGEDDVCPRTEIMLHIDPVMSVAAYIKDDWKVLFGPEVEVPCQTTEFYQLNISSVNWDIAYLYNITADPCETDDLHFLYPDLLAEFKAEIARYIQEQTPMQCQLETLDWSYPNSDIPYYIPFDFRYDPAPEGYDDIKGRPTLE